MKEKKVKKVFQDVPIHPEKIANSIANHQSKTTIEDHSIYLGQVGESYKGRKISYLEFSVDETEAELILHEIREETFSKFDLTCMHVYHSLGAIPVGQLYLFVFTSSSKKEEATKACDHLVKEIEERVPIKRSEVPIARH